MATAAACRGDGTVVPVPGMYPTLRVAPGNKLNSILPLLLRYCHLTHFYRRLAARPTGLGARTYNGDYHSRVDVRSAASSRRIPLHPIAAHPPIAHFLVSTCHTRRVRTFTKKRLHRVQARNGKLVRDRVHTPYPHNHLAFRPLEHPSHITCRKQSPQPQVRYTRLTSTVYFLLNLALRTASSAFSFATISSNLLSSASMTALSLARYAGSLAFLFRLLSSFSCESGPTSTNSSS